MIIWLASYPRSGNTMVQLLLKENFGLESFRTRPLQPRPKELPDGTSRRQRQGERQARADGLERLQTIDDAAALEPLRNSPAPHPVKTHHPPFDDSAAIYILRDGRDTLVSYAHYLRARWSEIAKLSYDESLEAVIRGELGFGSWSQHVATWRQHRGPMVILRYEDAVARPLETTTQALSKLGVDLKPTGTPPVFAEYQQRWPHFFRKGQVGGWREEMPPRLHSLFWEIHGEEMRRCGYVQQAAA